MGQILTWVFGTAYLLGGGYTAAYVLSRYARRFFDWFRDERPDSLMEWAALVLAAPFYLLWYFLGINLVMTFWPVVFLRIQKAKRDDKAWLAEAEEREYRALVREIRESNEA